MSPAERLREAAKRMRAYAVTTNIRPDHFTLAALALEEAAAARLVRWEDADEPNREVNEDAFDTAVAALDAALTTTEEAKG